MTAAVVLCGCRQPAAPAGCIAELSGSFAESLTSPQACPNIVLGAGATRGDQLLHLELPSRVLGGNLAISLDLGPSPTPGAFNSGTTDLWSAKGTRAVGSVGSAGACVFLASNNSTPNGDFTLDLASVAPLHGTLRLRLFVLPRASATGVQTDCGPSTTEELLLRF